MVEIRPAREGEEESILGAVEWLFAAPGSPPRGWDPVRARERLSRAMAASDAAVFVAQAGSVGADGGRAGEPRGRASERELVGVCTAYLGPDSVRFGLRCWVEELAVHPDWRSQGVGTRLLDRASEWGAGLGATHLKLDSDEGRVDAHRFYERRAGGWRSISYAWPV